MEAFGMNVRANGLEKKGNIEKQESISWWCSSRSFSACMSKSLGQRLLSHVVPLSSPSAHFLLIAQLHFTDCGKCFIKYWKGVCPQGWIPNEKCIPTAAWVCLHSHVGLIKASRKSAKKQPYCLCTIFTLHGLIVKGCGYNHKRVLGRYLIRLLWHDYPLVII